MHANSLNRNWSEPMRNLLFETQYAEMVLFLCPSNRPRKPDGQNTSTDALLFSSIIPSLVSGSKN